MGSSDSEVYGDLFEQIDDFLLDFSKDDIGSGSCFPIAGQFEAERGDSSSTSSGAGKRVALEDDFSELPIPGDDIEQLDWLSNFFEEPSFPENILALDESDGGMSETTRSRKSSPVSVLGTQEGLSSESFDPVVPRGKRSRPPSSSSSWATEPEIPTTKRKKKEKRVNSGEPRRCKHCGIDRTPQWRMGPMGPKSLCNACGVRYKSGRLFPEYRPAASPTFMAALHSNSHKKVMEMRLKSGVWSH